MGEGCRVQDSGRPARGHKDAGGKTSRPLAGWRVLVTRAEHQADDLSRALDEAGAEPVELPVIQMGPSPEPKRLDAALLALNSFDWVVFTSANTVRAVAARLGALGVPIAELARCRLAAIGPATAAALAERGLAVEVVPDEYVAEGVLRALAPRDTWQGRRVLLPRAAKARDTLPEGLRALGANVEVVAAYTTVPADPPNAKDVLTQLANGQIHAVTFTSPSTVHGFARLWAVHGREGARFVVACIGPVTAAAARESGLPVDVTARAYTVAGLVAALAAYRQKGAGSDGVS